MTLLQAIRSNLTIEPGQKINTLGGWCRRDTVMIGGREIGKIQVRRRAGRTEIITLADNVFVMGHNVDWLVGLKGGHFGINSSPAANL
ncbi:MAG TPA: hypothetical protein VNO70_10955 [Blastocatellia bacterium]|nr:hypothetical protein [Blastocatellia bacterium]